MARHVLFICSQNLLRSPTAERIFAGRPGIETASAGLAPDAVQPVTPECLAWADQVFVMEPAHQQALATHFRAHLGRLHVICLGIPDRYRFMDPELVRLLEQRVTPHLP